MPQLPSFFFFFFFVSSFYKRYFFVISSNSIRKTGLHNQRVICFWKWQKRCDHDRLFPEVFDQTCVIWKSRVDVMCVCVCERASRILFLKHTVSVCVGEKHSNIHSNNRIKDRNFKISDIQTTDIKIWCFIGCNTEVDIFLLVFQSLSFFSLYAWMNLVRNIFALRGSSSHCIAMLINITAHITAITDLSYWG